MAHADTKPSDEFYDKDETCCSGNSLLYPPPEYPPPEYLPAN